MSVFWTILTNSRLVVRLISRTIDRSAKCEIRACGIARIRGMGGVSFVRGDRLLDLIIFF
jgi:hypothetical protein